MSNAYNEIELMICTASRIFEDGASVSVGTGIPCAAVMLAQKLYAPNILITFEAGAVAPILPAMPISVGDSTTMHKAFQTSSTCDQMEMIQRGLIGLLFLGGAQIDMYGNINSTVIGDYKNQKQGFLDQVVLTILCFSFFWWCRDTYSLWFEFFG